MILVPILALADFVKEFFLEMDASRYGLGAVLMQKDQPLAYSNHAFGPQTHMNCFIRRN